MIIMGAIEDPDVPKTFSDTSTNVSFELQPASYDMKPYSMLGTIEGAVAVLGIRAIIDASKRLLSLIYERCKRKEDPKIMAMKNDVKKQDQKHKESKLTEIEEALKRTANQGSVNQAKKDEIARRLKLLQQEINSTTQKEETTQCKISKLENSFYLCKFIFELSASVLFLYVLFKAPPLPATADTIFNLSFKDSLNNFEKNRGRFTSSIRDSIHSEKVAIIVGALGALLNGIDFLLGRRLSNILSDIPVVGLINGGLFVIISECVLYKESHYKALSQVFFADYYKTVTQNGFVDKLREEVLDRQIRQKLDKNMDLKRKIVAKFIDAQCIKVENNFLGIIHGHEARFNISLLFNIYAYYKILYNAILIYENFRDRSERRRRSLLNLPLSDRYQNAMEQLQMLHQKEPLINSPSGRPSSNPLPLQFSGKAERPNFPDTRIKTHGVADPVRARREIRRGYEDRDSKEERERFLWKPDDPLRMQKLKLVNDWRGKDEIKREQLMSEISALASFLGGRVVGIGDGSRQRIEWTWQENCEERRASLNFETPHGAGRKNFSGFKLQKALNVLEVGWIFGARDADIRNHFYNRVNNGRCEDIFNALGFALMERLQLQEEVGARHDREVETDVQVSGTRVSEVRAAR